MSQNGEYGQDSTARLPHLEDLHAVDTLPEPDFRLTASDQATVDALRPGTALLIAMRGPNAGSRFLLDADEVSAGRHPESDIFLDDVTVSRRHAVFRREPDGYQVQDVGSLNGTYVNMQLVDSAVLRDGDEVMVGKFRLVFHPSKQAAEPPVAPAP